MTNVEQLQRRKRMAADVAAGMSVREVRLKYDVGRKTVSNACREFGVETPRMRSIREEAARLRRLARKAAKLQGATT